MAKHYIHSTCGQSMVFNITEPRMLGDSEQNTNVIGKISIGGGAWVINKNSRIPKVVITEVTDEELIALQGLRMFQDMCKKGYLSVHTVDHMEADSRDLPADHQKKDNCSQIEDADHADGTDERISHGETRASYGEDNQFGGKQPIATKDSSFGEIRL